MTTQADDQPVTYEMLLMLCRGCANEHRELRKALADLVDWGAMMGGWEAPCWDRAKRLIERIPLDPTTPDEEEIDSDDGQPRCTNPEGHSFVEEEREDGREGRSYCEWCGTDGDA